MDEPQFCLGCSPPRRPIAPSAQADGGQMFLDGSQPAVVLGVGTGHVLLELWIAIEQGHGKAATFLIALN